MFFGTERASYSLLCCWQYPPLFVLNNGQTVATKLRKQVVPPCCWPAQPLARCGRLPHNFYSLCLRLLLWGPLIPSFSFTHRPPGSCTISTLRALNILLRTFYTPRPVWMFSPRCDVMFPPAHWFFLFLFLFVLGFISASQWFCFANGSSVRCYIQLWLPLLCSTWAQTEMGRIWDNSFKLATAHRLSYTLFSMKLYA